MTVVIKDLRADHGARAGLLAVNSANAIETSLLTDEKFARMIAAARHGRFVQPDAAFILAFEQDSKKRGHS